MYIYGELELLHSARLKIEPVDVSNLVCFQLKIYNHNSHEMRIITTHPCTSDNCLQLHNPSSKSLHMLRRKFTFGFTRLVKYCVSLWILVQSHHLRDWWETMSQSDGVLILYPHMCQL